jgi:hypothetical protein
MANPGIRVTDNILYLDDCLNSIARMLTLEVVVLDSPYISCGKVFHSEQMSLFILYDLN